MDEEPAQASIFGKVIAVFQHRFVIDTGVDVFLADIGAQDVHLVGLREGDNVLIRGERQLTGIKVTEITMGPGKPILIEHNNP